MKALIVDDQRSARRVLSALLTRHEEMTVREASSIVDALASAAESPPDVAFVDLCLGPEIDDRSGLALVAALRERTQARIVVVTGHGDVESVRAALKEGAWDYLLKDELCEEIVGAIVERAREAQALAQEVVAHRTRAQTAPIACGLVGSSAAMTQLRDAIARVALSDRPALVVGPSGSGKELVVRALHTLGRNPGHPLLDINCGAVPDALLESQLFGHERGAFTGADRRVTGYLEAVRSGTLFLDEIAEMPLSLQSKLLRVLEQRRFRSVGAVEDRAWSGRVIAATHADLETRVREGTFREDLFHRLDVLRIHVPSLDERKDDIPALVAHFVSTLERPLRFTAEAMMVLVTATWPGNVRQLRNLVDRVSVFHDGDVVTPATLAPFLTRSVPPPLSEIDALADRALSLDVPDKLVAFEDALVRAAMRLAQGNKSAAARWLGVHRKAVERRLGADRARE